MDDSKDLGLGEIRAFLAGSQSVQFQGLRREEMYAWVERTLVRQQYGRLGRADKGLVRRFVAKVTGLSRAQVTRLITMYGSKGEVKARLYQRRRFPTRYTKADVELLAYVDRMHATLSGPATKRILEREFSDYGQAVYERLSKISVAQIYRFRKTAEYRRENITYQSTRPTPVAIGERRRPDPEGRPGYLRVDTVHQGDQEGRKGLYHINAVDEVTQWQVVGAAPQISEAFLLPVLTAMLEQFPFRLHGFHSDNGSEFINHTVAKLLNKLFIEQTKSRPRHSNDNGLVECKNGAVIRKLVGWGHIPSQHAEAMNRFQRQFLNPYLNFHRPCAIPEIETSPKGKTKRVYRRWATPWEIFQNLPGCETFLRPGVTLQSLEQQVAAQSDTDAAREMQEAKRQLWAELGRRRA